MNEIKLVITTDSSGAVTGVKNLESQIGSSSDAMTGKLKNVAAGLVAAFGAREIVSSIKDYTLLAARVETLGVVLDVVGRNAGKSQSQMQAYAEGVKSMGITTQESLQTVIRMSQAQMDLNKSSDLARVAQDAAVIGSTNSSDALNKLVYGIQSAQTEVLRTIGINVSFEESYKKLAQQLSTTSEKLTEQQKVQARTDAVMEAGTRIAGAYEASMGTVGKQLTSLARYSEEAERKIGELFTPALSVAVIELTESLKNLNSEMDSLKKTGEADSWAKQIADGMRDIIAEAYRLGMLLDKIGGTLTTIGYYSSFGTSEKMKGWNKTFEERYKSSDRMLMDMAMRGEGYRVLSNEELEYSSGLFQPWETPIGQKRYYTKQAEQPKPSFGGGAPAAGKNPAGPTAAELKKLAAAQAAWQEKIDLMNPTLNEFDKKVLQIEQDAQKLRGQFGDQAWITKGEEWGKAFIQWAEDIAAAEKQAEMAAKAAAEMERVAAENKQKALDLTLRLAGAEAQRAEMNLGYDQRELELKHRYGEIGSGRAASSAFDMDVRRLEIARDFLSVEIEKRTEATSYEDTENGIFTLGLQIKAVEEEINRLLGLRSAILKEHEGTMSEGFATGWNKYFDDMGSEFQRGEGYARDMASAMHSSLEEFFFDPMSASWESLWNSMRRIAAKQMADLAMDLLKSQSGSGGIGSIFSMIMGLFQGAGGQNIGLGNTVDMFSFHTGGAGNEGKRTPAFVIPSLLPRAHTGLGPRERVTVTLDDETIFTAGQTRALGMMARSGGAQAQPVNITINALDSANVAEWAYNNQDILASAGMAAARENHPSRKM